MTTSTTRVRRGAASATVAAFALSGLVALGAAPAGAAFDPSCNPAGPVLKTLKISPGKVNVKKRQRTVVISGTTTGPALEYVSVYAAPTGKGPARSGATFTPKARSFSLKVTVPKGAAKGWHNMTLALSGKNDTFNSYIASDLSDKGFPSRFNVVSNPDLKAPAIKKITIATKRVNTTKKAAKVQVSAKLTDKGGSGLSGAVVEVSNGAQEGSAVLRKKKGKWTGTAIFPKWAGNKKATVVGATVYDKAGNYTYYGAGATGKKLTKALKAGFKVKSKTDKKNPVVVSASATPTSAKVGSRRWEVKYKVKAKDAHSGVASVDVSLTLPDAAYSYGTASATLRLKKGTWAGTGVIQCYVSPGTYVIEVVVTDKAGRATTAHKGRVTLN